MALKDKLEAKAMKADEIIKKLAGASQEPAATPATPATAEPAAAPTTPLDTQPPAEPAPDTATPEPTTPTIPSVEQEPPQERPAESTGVDERIAAFEAKYKTLQGKYNAEVPAAAARLRELEAENRTLLKIVDEQRQGKPAADADTTPTSPAKTGFGKDDEQRLRDTLGDEITDALLKLRSDGAPAPELQQQLADLTNRVAQTSFEAFKQQLGVHFPGFESLDRDPGFLQWLSEEDAFAGVPRQQLLRDAVSKGNAVRAAQFFSTYAGLKTPEAPAPVTQVKTPVRTPSLASQQTPKKAGGTPPPPLAPKVYSAAEYKSLMQEACRLRTEDPKRAKQIIEELDRAVADRRVR